MSDSDFGLKPEGFNRKRLDDIKLKIEEDLTDAFGALNLGPDSVFGQLVGIFSNANDQVWQEMENVYFSQYIATAEGTSLDNAVALQGLVRLEAQKTKVTLAVTGHQGVIIPAGSQVQIQGGGAIFTNPHDGEITRLNVFRGTIIPNIALSETIYSVFIDGQAFSINSGMGATIQSIIDDIVEEINIKSADVTATDLGNESFEIVTNDFNESFSLMGSSNFTILSRTSPILFEAVNTGSIQALVGTVNEIITPVSGWQSVTNYIEGLTGRARETDAELRLRARGSRVLGSGSVEAIQARLRQNVLNVVTALVFENRTAFVDQLGRPPHSFEAVVLGGADDAIAKEIWDNKPAGIETFGTEEVYITDSNGDSQLIKFSRPVRIYIWIKCQIRVGSGTFPINGTDVIRTSLADFGNDNFNIGEKILYQQFYEPVYDVAGVLEAILEFGTSDSEHEAPLSYDSANIDIAETQIGVFSSDRVTVTIV